MAQLDVLLKAKARDTGVRKFFRDATKLADKFAMSAERAARAGMGLGGLNLPAASGRGGRAAAPRSRADPAERSRQRSARDFDRVLSQQLAAGRREARMLEKQARQRAKQSRNIRNLTDEQLTQLEVEREITRRRRRDARSRAKERLGGDGRKATPFQKFEIAENLAVAGGVFEDFGAQVESGIRTSFDAFKDYERGVVEVSTLTEDIPVDQIREITSAAAEEFGGLPTDQVSAFYAIVSAGATDAASAQEQLTAANKLAIAGAASQEASVLAISKAVANFGSQGVTSAKAADSLFIAVQKGQTTVEEMARALPIVAQAASTAGLSIDETNAALAVLSKRFPKSSEGASALRQALSNIAKPTKTAADEAKRLGIDFSTAGIEAAGGLEEFLLKLRAAEKFDENTLAKLFESTEARAAIGGLIDGLDELNATTKASVDGQGAVSKAFDKTSETAAQQAKRLEAQFELLKIEAGEALVPALLDLSKAVSPILKQLTEFIRENPNAAKSLASLAVQAAIFGRVAGGVTKALSAWNTLGGLTELGMGKLGATTTATTTATTKFGKASSALRAGVGALPAVFVGAQLAILAFNTVLDQAQKPLAEYESAIDRIADSQKSLPSGTDAQRETLAVLKSEREVLATQLEQTKSKRKQRELNEEIAAKNEEIASAQRDIDEQAGIDALVRQRENLAKLVNESRRQARVASGGAARETLAGGDVGGAFGQAYGALLNRATGASDEFDRQVRQNELDLARFDREFGARLGLTREQQFGLEDFTTAGLAGEGGFGERLAQNAQAQLEALQSIAQNTQTQPWNGPSMEAGLT